MRSPLRLECAPALLRRSHQLLSRTKSIPQIAEPVSQFEAAVASYEEHFNALVRARRQVTVAIGDHHQAEEALREELRGVGLIVLKIGRGRRSFELYRKYFPMGYGKSLHLSPDESIAVAAGLIAALADETVPAIMACREPLQAAVTRLESARTARQTALNARFEAKQILQDERIAWEKAFQKFYFDCRYVMSDHRSYVESLFDTSGRGSAEEETEEDAEENKDDTEEGNEGSPATASPPTAEITKLAS
jgi:hypothetical protein